MKNLTITLLTLLVLGGCASGNGYMRSVDDQGQSISITFNQGMMSDSYTAEYRGEVFTGRAVQLGTKVSFGVAFVGDVVASGISSTATGDFKAILIGNEGTSFKCLMNYAAPTGLINFGGVGSCVHSSGNST